MTYKDSYKLIYEKNFTLKIEIIFSSENMFVVQASAMQRGVASHVVCSGLSSNKDVTVARNDAVIDLATNLSFFNKE